MKIGIVGLPGSGKTTLFNLLTGLSADTTPFRSGKRQVNLGAVKVPDDRLDKLAELYAPKKVTHTEISFVDLAGLPKREDRSQEGVEDLFPYLRDADALTLVLRDFESERVPAAKGRVDPAAELDEVRTDLILADLGSIEKKLERLAKEKKSGDKARIREHDLFERAKSCLEEERFLSDLPLTPEEEMLFTGYGFLTQKGILLLRNVGEEEGSSLPEGLPARAEGMNAPVISLNILLEKEVLEIPDEERRELCKSLGIEGGARDRFVRAAFESLNLISFFTVSQKEVHAWTVTKGICARRAAGKIHSDMERGFIRAEVTPFQDLADLGGEKAVREKGRMRLEGKDYLVRDGDVIFVRFSA